MASMRWPCKAGATFLFTIGPRSEKHFSQKGRHWPHEERKKPFPAFCEWQQNARLRGPLTAETPALSSAPPKSVPQKAATALAGPELHGQKRGGSTKTAAAPKLARKSRRGGGTCGGGGGGGRRPARSFGPQFPLGDGGAHGSPPTAPGKHKSDPRRFPGSALWEPSFYRLRRHVLCMRARGA